MAATQTPPSAYIGLIACIVLCLLFGLLFYTTNSRLTEALEGGEKIAPNATLPALQTEAGNLRTEIRKAEDEKSARRADLARAELDLVKHRTSYANYIDLVSATATPQRPRETIFGTDTQSKASPWKITSDLVTAKNAASAAQAGAAKADDNTRFQAMEDAIKKRQDDLQVVLQEMTRLDAGFKTDQEALNAKLDELNKAKEGIERAASKAYGERATRINQLEDQIRELLELDLRFVSEILPVGEVLQVNERGDRTIINLTSADRILPGMVFLVFTYDHGHFVEKGLLEVIKTTSKLSECKVTSLVDGRRLPMARGDKLGNPVYNPQRPPVFVFAGEFAEYNRSDLADFVRAAGGVVWDKLQPGVDFLVVRGDPKDRSDMERAQAREFQILAITERQLLRFVRPAFVPK
ncbi:hypothetical protein LBMAG53_39220 [Planctomycetota bacterium]|nr:hypothetical protein LBMAG53_39220 [Planctomycetota bacterium]